MSAASRGDAPGHRAGQMWDRIARTLAAAGLPAVEGGRVLDALETALAHRVSRLDDPQDPRLLHPARTLLILLDDARCRDSDVLTAGALLDSRFPALTASPGAVRNLPQQARTEASALLAQIPRPPWPEAADPGVTTEDRLLEDLLALPDGARDLALCETLDHLRHLHLEPADSGVLERGIQMARIAFLPAARRTGGVLARRYEWWERTFSNLAEQASREE